MRTRKTNQDDEDYGEDEMGSRREGPSSSTPSTTVNNNTNKDAKNSDRASAIRSKHSVTEQRRRCKINERFQKLKELIPHSDHKKDTASFLLEVIDYVQHLQEKVQKYENSYPGWSLEPAKLMPWRSSHWRGQGFVPHQPTLNNGSGTGTSFPGKLEEHDMTVASAMLTGTPNQCESDASRDIACNAMDRQTELEKKGLGLSVPLQDHVPLSRSTNHVATTHASSEQEELVIEEGTINISSAYSQELLSSLTQALQTAGVDLSHARISIQINLGKGASPDANAKDSLNPMSANQTSGVDESNQASKRFKT